MLRYWLVIALTVAPAFAVGFSSSLFRGGTVAAQEQSTAIAPLPKIAIDSTGKGFVEVGTGKAFRVKGVNYDHDAEGRLLEDYWIEKWPEVESDFREIKALGVNVVRVHLQFGKFMDDRNVANSTSLLQLGKLIALAEKEQLYLNLTGLGCYHKKDVPAWYDALDESERWEVQQNFWREVARVAKGSSAIFCYDLMNEPVVPGGKREPAQWLGPDFVGKHFVQFITLDQNKRPRSEVAKLWIEALVSAIREVDTKTMITVGMVDWSLDRPGLTSGFDPTKVAERLDFISTHIYPETDKIEEALATLRGFDIGKPIVIEETFPLKCSGEELANFLRSGIDVHDGYVSFYWGTPIDAVEKPKSIGEAITLEWLKRFKKM